MQNPSSSSKEEGNEELCWPEGGWLEVHLPRGPPCIALEASNANVSHLHAGYHVDKLPIKEAKALFFDI